MEVTWNSIHGEVSLDPAALFLLQLFLNSVFDISPPLLLIVYFFNADLLSILVKAVLEEMVGHNVRVVGAHDILNVQAQDITWHFWEGYIDVHIYEIISMR